MRIKTCIIYFPIFVMIQFCLWVPLNAIAFDVSDIALTPGQDITELNIAWHHTDNDCECVAEIAEKSHKGNGHYAEEPGFPEHSY